MQGPRINLVPDNLPLSTLKRKDMPHKALAHRKKKKIDSTVVDIPNLAEKLAGAFEVCLLLISSPFSSYLFINPFLCIVFGINWTIRTGRHCYWSRQNPGSDPGKPN
jgi:hypothetical protein